MKTAICVFVSFMCIQTLHSQELKVDFPFVKEVHYQNHTPVDFARFGVCQLRFDIQDTTQGLKGVKDIEKTKSDIRILTQKAITHQVNVLVFPELSLGFDKANRNEILSYLQEVSAKNDMIIIAGSYYNANRQSTVPIILPTETVYSYKIKQSKFEVSPLSNEGMTRGDTLVVISSKYGNILPIVCVDLISDDVQFVARHLSNKNQINTLVNIGYNPAAGEFMREMAALVKRHNLFGIIANVAQPDPSIDDKCLEYGFGNSSVFASLFIEQARTTKLISDCFKDCSKTKLLDAYSTLISQMDPDEEGMILFDLNLSTVRPPKRTNAPDQGYPTLKNLQQIKLAE
jgi:predicted amidohydrolase